MIYRKGIIVLALLAATYVTTGCGVVQSMRENCGGNDLCEYFLGRDYTASDKKQDELANSRYSEMQASLNELVTNMALLSQNETQNSTAISNLQTQTNLLLVQMAQISTGLRITELLDPCGDGAGYDEVLVRLSDGRLLAYFETGGNRFLAVLTNNAYYRTTDAQLCNFYVTVSGNVVW